MDITLEVVEEQQVNMDIDFSITIAPIPPNYGLITWDGNILTVS